MRERDGYLSPFDREPAFLIAKRDIVNPTDSILSITLILKIHKSITCKRKTHTKDKKTQSIYMFQHPTEFAKQEISQLKDTIF